MFTLFQKDFKRYKRFISKVQRKCSNNNYYGQVSIKEKEKKSDESFELSMHSENISYLNEYNKHSLPSFYSFFFGTPQFFPLRIRYTCLYFTFLLIAQSIHQIFNIHTLIKNVKKKIT